MDENSKEIQRARDGIIFHVVALAVLLITFALTEGQRRLNLDLINSREAEPILAIGFTAFVVFWLLSIWFFLFGVTTRSGRICLIICCVEIALVVLIPRLFD